MNGSVQTERGTEVKVPHLAESLVSAVVAKWIKQPGERVEEYDVLCELFTDKVNVEMPSPIAGTLVEWRVGEGVSAAVGETLCIIREDGTAAAPQQQGGHSLGHGGVVGEAEVAEATDDSGSMRYRYSPAVQRLAAEHRLDLGQIAGTGLGGRITRKDVELAIQLGNAVAGAPKVPNAAVATSLSAASQPSGTGVAPEAAPSQQTAAPSGEPLIGISAPPVPVRTTGIHLSSNPPLPRIEVEPSASQTRNETYIDITPMRNLIASRTRQSATEIPHAWTMIEVDVTNLVLLRNRIKADFLKQEGINITYLPFVLKAVVNAIKDYPIINSVWATDKIIVKRDINLSLFVGTEDSVVGPVIKRADERNIAGLTREIDTLTKKARSGKLSLEDMQGGTFTVNNTGAFGSILSYPIINYPQAAILTFESIVKRPVVINDMIGVRSMVNMCLSLDHRILDGVICGRFLQRVKENLESYGPDTKVY